MNASALARNAYSGATRIAPSHTQTEYRAFAEVTRELAEHVGDEHVDFPRLATALHRNQVLWGILADDVASGENELPASLRAQLFYLAEFTTVQTQRILKSEATVDALVDINTAIMSGLRANEGAE